MTDIIPVLVSLGLVSLLAYLLRASWNPKTQSPEPPSIPSQIPPIGHLAGFVYYGLEYFRLQSARTALPAFTMDMFFNKVYVIRSPRLVSAVRRSHRTLSFDPLVTRTAECVGGISGCGLDRIREKASQGQGLGHHTVVALRPTLLGKGLDQMNEIMVSCLQSSVQELRPHRGRVDLYGWCRLAMTIASTEAVYGPLNPYSQISAREAYWLARYPFKLFFNAAFLELTESVCTMYREIEENLSFLMIGIAPWLVARKAWKGRQYLAQAFLQYYQSGGHLNASELAYARWQSQNEAGAALEDIARLEVVMGLGLLSNTVPTSFWVIFDIFSRPKLVQEIRDEICGKVLSISPDGVYTVDLADVQERCSLLLASFQETLRIRSNSAQFRMVYEDTMLDDSCLVKAGSIIVMPAAVINRDESVWGPTPDDFNPQQFLAPGVKRHKASAFMSFGTSPHICAGRHFATGEILALITMLILQFDISPVGDGWIEPAANVKAVAASLSPPVGRTPVIFSERQELKGVKWDFKVTPGKGRYSLVTG
ncbi:putative cholesterol 7alpha-monooxygenase [Microsporum audouinii]